MGDNIQVDWWGVQFKTELFPTFFLDEYKTYPMKHISFLYILIWKLKIGIEYGFFAGCFD